MLWLPRCAKLRRITAEVTCTPTEMGSRAIVRARLSRGLLLTTGTKVGAVLGADGVFLPSFPRGAGVEVLDFPLFADAAEAGRGVSVPSPAAEGVGVARTPAGERETIAAGAVADLRFSSSPAFGAAEAELSSGPTLSMSVIRPPRLTLSGPRASASGVCVCVCVCCVLCVCVCVCVCLCCVREAEKGASQLDHV